MSRLITIALCVMFALASCDKHISEEGGIIDNLTWKINDNGMLIISGTGAMPATNDMELLPWFEYRSSITAVVIESGITSISRAAFTNFSNLTSITIPNSVTSIGEAAFAFCSSLTSITIPNSVVSIGRRAFFDSGLTTVTLPYSVKSIGDMTFSRCSGLISINVDAANSTFCSDNGVLFNKTKTTLLQYPTGRTGIYTIPNAVVQIGNNAFDGCVGLTEAIISNSVESIGDMAFCGSGLTKVTIPNSVIFIGDFAFSDCRNLTEVIIGNSIESIGNSIFFSCIGLTSVIISNSVTSIGSNAFQNCIGLTSISIPNSVTFIGGYTFVDCIGLTKATDRKSTRLNSSH